MEKVAGEVININNRYSSYQEYKAAVDSEMQRSAEGFVRIGYLLKLARDTDILKDTPYESVNEFAQSEYGLDKSQVSRFIRINDEYSEGGYSDRLLEKYRGYGYAKLALMLLLPAPIAEEISPDYSKSEIQAVKEEIDEEKKVTDIEVMLEGRNRQQESMDSTLDKVLHQLGHDQPELYVRMMRARCEDYPNLYDTPMGKEGYTDRVSGILSEILAPSGEAIHSVRIQGTGRMMMSIKGADRDIAVVNVRSEEKECFGWQQMIAAVDALAVPEASPEHEKEWEMLYGEPFPKEPEKTEAAPLSRTVPKKQGKVTRAKTGKEEKAGGAGGTEDKQVDAAGSSIAKEPEAAGPDQCHPEPDGAVQTEEEQITGQMQLEKDFPECCQENAEVAPVQPEMPEHIVKEAYAAYMEGFKDHLDSAYELTKLLAFAEAKKKLDLAGDVLEKLAGLPLLNDEEEADE